MPAFPPLRLPAFNHQVRKQGDILYIYDEIRRKFLQLTPEEWVRQHVVHCLLGLGYPKGRLQVEGGLQYNQRQKRTDLLAWDAQGAPYLLVECKAPTVRLSAEVWAQAAVYNAVRQAPYVAITNGLQHLFGQWDGTCYQPMGDWPAPR
jgi:hypothetical protein